MLQDESLEYIQEQYEEKNMVLSQFGEQVNAHSLYEDIFEDLDREMPVVIIDDNLDGKRILSMSINDALEMGSCRNDVLLGGCTYFHNWISKKSAKDIYTFIIDYDNAYSGTLLKALQDDWKSANGEVFAKPTYIVNSGTGLHLYFVLKNPLPCYRRSLQSIDKIYRELAIQQSRRVYAQRQVQWFGQDFRIAGGKNKYNWENTIFKIGDKWDVFDLAEVLNVKDIEIMAKREIKPKTVKKKHVKRNYNNGWKTNPAFYNYALEQCHEKTREGNRYTSMCALSVIAWKCGVPEEKLENDLLNLLPDYNKGATRIIKEKEVYSAMKMYNEKAMETPRGSLENWQGWEYKPPKRNGRKQSDHLLRARTVQKLDYPDGEWRNKEGRPKKEELIREYILKNPNKSVMQIASDLGVSRPTVYKYKKG